MNININGVEVEMRCSNCFHWQGARDQPDTIALCIAEPPKAFLVYVPKSNIQTAEINEEEVIKSAWPSTQGIRRCGAFMPFQLQTSIPYGVTRQ